MQLFFYDLTNKFSIFSYLIFHTQFFCDNFWINHNAKVLNKETEPKVEIVNGVPKTCCEDPTMPERCDQTNVIDQADLHAKNRVMSYYGLTENEFKKRCSTHKTSFRYIPKCHTTLSRAHLSTAVAWREKNFKHFVFYKYFSLVLGLLKSRISETCMEGLLNNPDFKLFHYRVFKLDMIYFERLLGHQKCTFKS